jgi:hypothetical protein
LTIGFITANEGGVKLKRKPKAQGPIAPKAIKELKKQSNQKILNLRDYRDAKITAENLEKTIINPGKLRDYDPLHAIYIYARNKLSVWIFTAMTAWTANSPS